MIHFSFSFILIRTPINHLLGSLNYRCMNTRLSEQKFKILPFVNSIYAVRVDLLHYVALLCLGVPEGCHFGSLALPRRGYPTPWRRSTSRRGFLMLQRRSPKCPDFLVFLFCNFSPKILKIPKQNMGITPNNILISS